MSEQIIIYGEGLDAGKAAGLIRLAADKTTEIHLRSAKRFKGVEDCKAVYIVGDYPEIAEAYGDKATTVQAKEEVAFAEGAESDDQPRKIKKGGK